VGFGAAKPPREVFLVGFGGFAAKTNQKLGCGAAPQTPVLGDFCGFGAKITQNYSCYNAADD
jgi:hypothetical protein